MDGQSLRDDGPAGAAADWSPAGSDRLKTLPAPIPLRARRWVGFPTVLPPLIGREEDLARLVALVRQSEGHPITLIGPGGVGKTRLALAAAEACADSIPDGAAFVPLASVSDPTLVLSAIARALDIREVAGRPLREAVAYALQGRRFLLLLDNFEHVLEAATDVARLVADCPALAVLVTSRAPLRLSGEQRFVTTPLALPEAKANYSVTKLAGLGAIALFVERARWVQPDFSLSDQNAEAVGEICRSLDGLPLAIELAAAWMRVLSPQALLERLEPRLPLLRGGAADQPVRLRTMRDAIAWSYDLLTPEEARLFRRLAVFVGGFTLDAAEWVGGREEPVLDLLAGLIDKSLLYVQTGSAETRFMMLETLREFALEGLVESGEAPEVAALHASFMLAMAEQAAPDLLGPHEWHWMACFDTELGNLRATLAWALEHDIETALRIGAALRPYFGWRHPAEGRRWLTAALSHPAPASALVCAKALTVRAAMAVLEADAATGLEAGRAAASLAHEAGDVVAEAEARWMVGYSYFFTGDFAPAALELDRSLELAAQASTSTSRGWAANATWARGALAFVLGERKQGRRFYERALAQAREASSDLMTLLILSDFAGWLFDQGEEEHARAMLQESLTLAMDRDGFWFLSFPLIGLALIEAVAGKSVIAARSLGAVEALLTLSGQVVPHTTLSERVARATTLTKHVLGDDDFAVAWEEGYANFQGVIAEALGHDKRADALQSDGREAAHALSARQREVLALLVAGRSDRQIANELFISHRTASHHVAAIMAKLEARTRGEAAVRAVRARLI